MLHLLLPKLGPEQFLNFTKFPLHNCSIIKYVVDIDSYFCHISMEISKKFKVGGIERVQFGPNLTPTGNGHYINKIYILKLTYF